MDFLVSSNSCINSIFKISGNSKISGIQIELQYMGGQIIVSRVYDSWEDVLEDAQKVYPNIVILDENQNPVMDLPQKSCCLTVLKDTYFDKLRQECKFFTQFSSNCTSLVANPEIHEYKIIKNEQCLNELSSIEILSLTSNIPLNRLCIAYSGLPIYYFKILDVFEKQNNSQYVYTFNQPLVLIQTILQDTTLYIKYTNTHPEFVGSLKYRDLDLLPKIPITLPLQYLIPTYESTYCTALKGYNRIRLGLCKYLKGFFITYQPNKLFDITDIRLTFHSKHGIIRYQPQKMGSYYSFDGLDANNLDVNNGIAFWHILEYYMEFHSPISQDQIKLTFFGVRGCVYKDGLIYVCY